MLQWCKGNLVRLPLSILCSECLMRPCVVPGNTVPLRGDAMHPRAKDWPMMDELVVRINSVWIADTFPCDASHILHAKALEGKTLTQLRTRAKTASNHTRYKHKQLQRQHACSAQASSRHCCWQQKVVRSRTYCMYGQGAYCSWTPRRQPAAAALGKPQRCAAAVMHTVLAHWRR
jgi:hypothetical protein